MKIAVIGPTYPFRGGIAHYTTLLVQHLREHHDVRLISYIKQYPKWLYPGNTAMDPSPDESVLRVDCDRVNADSHLRAMILGHSLTLQVSGGEVVLGQWQRILMAELDGPRARTLRIQIWGIS